MAEKRRKKRGRISEQPPLGKVIGSMLNQDAQVLSLFRASFLQSEMNIRHWTPVALASYTNRA